LSATVLLLLISERFNSSINCYRQYKHWHINKQTNYDPKSTPSRNRM